MIKNFGGYHFVKWSNFSDFYRYENLLMFESDECHISQPHYLPEKAPSSVINETRNTLPFQSFLDKCYHE